MPRIPVFGRRFWKNFSQVVYSTDRSKTVLVLLFVALWFIVRGDLFYDEPCVILFLCFLVLLALHLPRLGKRELVLVRLSILLALRLPLPLGVWKGLRFVIVALPGLFPYTFLTRFLRYMFFL